jgi:pimeloyl-ACP methyl ester carboxylesterase
MPFKFSRIAVDNPTVDVVFIHGLRLFAGAPKTDWQFRHSRPFALSWPTTLQRDVESTRVGFLTYNATASNWFGQSMHLKEIADNLLRVLRNNGIGDRPVVFVAHSLGGLIIKELLLQSKNSDGNDGLLAKHCLGVAFLATPHEGSDLAYLLHRIKLFRPSRAVRHLISNNPGITYLKSDYSNWVESRGYVNHLVLSERLRTMGRIVVPAYSANPGIKDVKVMPIRANHRTIASPKAPSDDVYIEVKNFLTKARDRAIAIAEEAEARRQFLSSELYLRELESELLHLAERRLSAARRLDGAEPLNNMPEVDSAAKELSTVDSRISEVRALIARVPEDVKDSVFLARARNRIEKRRAEDERKALEDEWWDSLFAEFESGSIPD